MERRQFGPRLKEKDTYDESRGGNVPFLKRIGGRGLNRHKSTFIGQTSSGIRSFGVTRHRHSQEDIQSSGLHAKLGRRSYTIRIVYNHAIKGRLGGYFGGR